MQKENHNHSVFDVLDGQAPMTTFSLFWMVFLVFLWAGNAVVVKIAVRDIPPLWAAFFRFTPTLPFIALFIIRFGNGFNITYSEGLRILKLSLIMVVQIWLLNLGSMYTTGGRVALFLFSFPILVPLMGPMLIKNEYLNKYKIIGCIVALVGLITAMWGNLGAAEQSTLKGDLIELASCVLLALLMTYNKRLAQHIDKWKILFWEFIIAVPLFLVGAVLYEDIQIDMVQTDAWAALFFQSIVVGVFCWMSLQYLLAKHNATSVSIYFFLTPIFGMIISALLLHESPDSGLILGCLFVGMGIYIVTKY